MLFNFSFFAISAFLLGTVHCSRNSLFTPATDDEVKSLPGFNKILNFRHYSGYLDSTVNSHVHYWFFESQRNSSKDPLVLWLNGGPGCSSLLGALSEHGPLTLKSDMKLELNPYSWNTQVNVLYLESPAGVGFSYNDNGNHKTGDNETAELNYGALKSFLSKFPQYQDNDFYIAGESYGGIYVPTLSKLVYDRGYPKKFVGFALGNAFLDAQLNFDTQLYFFFYHGIIDTITWQGLLSRCCPSGSNTIEGGFCDFVHTNNPSCIEGLNAVQRKISQMPLNLYNIYGACDNANGLKKHPFVILHPETVSRASFLFNSTFNTRKRALHDDRENPPCINLDFMVDWLNQEDVKEALHISSKALKWSPCSPEINQNYVTEYTTMYDIVKQLVENGKRAVIYNGDIDAMCNYFGDELFTSRLGFKTLQDYRPWMYDNQIGGMVKFYQNIAFVTIRGAGHTVPMDKPGPAKKLFDTFINYKGDMMYGL